MGGNADEDSRKSIQSDTSGQHSWQKLGNFIPIMLMHQTRNNNY